MLSATQLTTHNSTSYTTRPSTAARRSRPASAAATTPVWRPWKSTPSYGTLPCKHVARDELRHMMLSRHATEPEEIPHVLPGRTVSPSPTRQMMARRAGVKVSAWGPTSPIAPAPESALPPIQTSITGAPPPRALDFSTEYEHDTPGHGTHARDTFFGDGARGNDDDMETDASAMAGSDEVGVDSFEAVGVARSIQARLRNELFRRGWRGIRDLAHALEITATRHGSTSSWIGIGECQEAFRRIKLGVTEDEVATLFRYHLDGPHAREINYADLYVGIRGELSQMRRKIIRAAFRKLDLQGTGKVRLRDAVRKFDARRHPKVLAGQQIAAHVAHEFAEYFDSAALPERLSHSPDRIMITYEDFEDYYAHIGATIESDDHFVMLVANTFNL